jgi:hypothetical protein
MISDTQDYHTYDSTLQGYNGSDDCCGDEGSVVYTRTLHGIAHNVIFLHVSTSSSARTKGKTDKTFLPLGTSLTESDPVHPCHTDQHLLKKYKSAEVIFG